MAEKLGSSRHRKAIRVRGVVQGVGFRPAIHRLAGALALTGFVRNELDSVLIEIEGDHAQLLRFMDALPRGLPPSARIESLEEAWVSPRGDGAFRIAESPLGAGSRPRAALPPDQAPCAACARELADPANRRFRYPFINCTDCGPRFTIARELPYDRERTTMRAFVLCAACEREYRDPGDRRFHAEPNACPSCGPRLRFEHGGRNLEGEPALAAAARLLSEGGLVAVKGVGGFLLAADATNEEAVARLRARKRRPAKPLAVMARDLAHAARIARLDAASRALLASAARPIVLAPAREGAPLAPNVAPGLGTVGVFLPPTPLQQLLLDDGPALQVMTSGNRGGEPIAKDEAEARERLSDIVDAFLLHDREVHARVDDSVVRVIAGAPVPLRRARGYVPEAIALPVQGPAVLAVGGDSKATLCLAAGGVARMSQHLGDRGALEAEAFFAEAARHLAQLSGIEARVVAHDLHPEYRSTAWARGTGLPRVAVQHHHAHVASCLAEHGRTGPALGVAFDGTGYGPDGTLWGGEVLLADLAGFRRLGHLRPLALPGGEAAIREPFRAAVAALRDAGEPLAPIDGVTEAARGRVASLLERGLRCPSATSAGRWFDAAAVLAGCAPLIRYDAQAAMEFEALAGDRPSEPYELELVEREGRPFEIDLRPAIRALARDRRRGTAREAIAARFHETMAHAIARACRRARGEGAPREVALTGGCFQNRRLAERAAALLRADGFEVLMHRRVPPNDGGLALGQAAVASHRLAASRGER